MMFAGSSETSEMVEKAKSNEQAAAAACISACVELCSETEDVVKDLIQNVVQQSTGERQVDFVEAASVYTTRSNSESGLRVDSESVKNVINELVDEVSNQAENCSVDAQISVEHSVDNIVCEVSDLKRSTIEDVKTDKPDLRLDAHSTVTQDNHTANKLKRGKNKQQQYAKTEINSLNNGEISKHDYCLHSDIVNPAAKAKPREKRRQTRRTSSIYNSRTHNSEFTNFVPPNASSSFLTNQHEILDLTISKKSEPAEIQNTVKPIRRISSRSLREVFTSPAFQEEPLVLKVPKVDGTGMLEKVSESTLKYSFQMEDYHQSYTDTGQKIYTCDVCTGVYQRPFSLKRHYLRSHVNYVHLSERDLSNCSIVLGDKVTVTDMNRVVQPDERDASSNVSLLPDLFRCHICSKCFDFKYTLKEHLDDHPALDVSGVAKPYKCLQCPASFTHQHNYKKHQAFHTLTTSTSMMYPCSYCYKAFSSPVVRRKHTQHHNEETSHSCMFLCGESYPDLIQLRRHLVSVHHNEYVGCSSCDERFLEHKSLNEHLISQHSNYPQHTLPATTDPKKPQADTTKQSDEKSGDMFCYPCNVCNQMFTNFVNMCKHRRSAHGTVGAKHSKSLMKPSEIQSCSQSRSPHTSACSTSSSSSSQELGKTEVGAKQDLEPKKSGINLARKESILLNIVDSLMHKNITESAESVSGIDRVCQEPPKDEKAMEITQKITKNDDEAEVNVTKDCKLTDKQEVASENVETKEDTDVKSTENVEGFITELALSVSADSGCTESILNVTSNCEESQSSLKNTANVIAESENTEAGNDLTTCVNINGSLKEGPEMQKEELGSIETCSIVDEPAIATAESKEESDLDTCAGISQGMLKSIHEMNEKELKNVVEPCAGINESAQGNAESNEEQLDKGADTNENGQETAKINEEKLDKTSEMCVDAKENAQETAEVNDEKLDERLEMCADENLQETAEVNEEKLEKVLEMCADTNDEKLENSLEKCADTNENMQETINDDNLDKGLQVCADPNENAQETAEINDDNLDKGLQVCADPNENAQETAEINDDNLDKGLQVCADRNENAQETAEINDDNLDMGLQVCADRNENAQETAEINDGNLDKGLQVCADRNENVQETAGTKEQEENDLKTCKDVGLNVKETVQMNEKKVENGLEICADVDDNMQDSSENGEHPAECNVESNAHVDEANEIKEEIAEINLEMREDNIENSQDVVKNKEKEEENNIESNNSDETTLEIKKEKVDVTLETCEGADDSMQAALGIKEEEDDLETCADASGHEAVENEEDESDTTVVTSAGDSAEATPDNEQDTSEDTPETSVYSQESSMYSQEMCAYSQETSLYSQGTLEDSSESQVSHPDDTSLQSVQRLSWEKYTFPKIYSGRQGTNSTLGDLSHFDIGTQLAIKQKSELPDSEDTQVSESFLQRELSLTEAVKDDDEFKDNGNILSGEWIRPRNYICCTCGNKHGDLWELEDHMLADHYNIWWAFLEVDTQTLIPSDLFHRTLNSVGLLGSAVEQPATEVLECACTKCGRLCHALPELHRHILECGGEVNWMNNNSPTRRKNKWRPFGSRRRRHPGRRGMKRNIPSSPVKLHRGRFKGVDSANDSIQRMIANLPAKRITRRVIQFSDDDIKTRSQATIHSVSFPPFSKHGLKKSKKGPFPKFQKRGRPKVEPNAEDDGVAVETPAPTPQTPPKLAAKKSAEKLSKKMCEELDKSSKKAGEQVEKTKKTMEMKTKKATEEKTKKGNEDNTKKANEEKVKKVMEDKVRKVNEEKIKKVTEDKAKKVNEEKVKKVILEKTKKINQEKAKKTSDESAKKGVEDKAKKVIADKPRKGAEDKTKKTTEDKGKKSSEDKTKKASEEKSKKASDEKSKKATEEKSKNATEEKSKKATEEKSKKATEEKSKKAVEGKSKKASEGRAKKAIEVKANKINEGRIKKVNEIKVEKCRGKAKRVCENKTKRTVKESVVAPEQESSVNCVEENAEKNADESASTLVEQKEVNPLEQNVSEVTEDNTVTSVEENSSKFSDKNADNVVCENVEKPVEENTVLEENAKNDMQAKMKDDDGELSLNKNTSRKKKAEAEPEESVESKKLCVHPPETEQTNEVAPVQLPTIFKCGGCETKFENQVSYEKHNKKCLYRNLFVQARNPKKPTLKCTYCDKPFVSAAAHAKHTNICALKITSVSSELDMPTLVKEEPFKLSRKKKTLTDIPVLSPVIKRDSSDQKLLANTQGKGSAKRKCVFEDPPSESQSVSCQSSVDNNKNGTEIEPTPQELPQIKTGKRFIKKGNAKKTKKKFVFKVDIKQSRIGKKGKVGRGKKLIPKVKEEPVDIEEQPSDTNNKVNETSKALCDDTAETNVRRRRTRAGLQEPMLTNGILQDKQFNDINKPGKKLTKRHCAADWKMSVKDIKKRKKDTETAKEPVVEPVPALKSEEISAKEEEESAEEAVSCSEFATVSSQEGGSSQEGNSWCEVCNKSYSSAFNLLKHKSSLKHKRNIKKCNEEGNNTTVLLQNSAVFLDALLNNENERLLRDSFDDMPRAPPPSPAEPEEVKKQVKRKGRRRRKRARNEVVLVAEAAQESKVDSVVEEKPAECVPSEDTAIISNNTAEVEKDCPVVDSEVVTKSEPLNIEPVSTPKPTDSNSSDAFGDGSSWENETKNASEEEPASQAFPPAEAEGSDYNNFSNQYGYGWQQTATSANWNYENWSGWNQQQENWSTPYYPSVTTPPPTNASFGSILGSVHQVLEDGASEYASSEYSSVGHQNQEKDFLESFGGRQSLEEIQIAMGATDEEMSMLQQLGQGAHEFVYDNNTAGETDILPLDNPDLIDLDNQSSCTETSTQEQQQQQQEERFGSIDIDASQPAMPSTKLLSVYEKKEMVCPVCNRHFLGLQALETHISWVHKVKDAKKRIFNKKDRYTALLAREPGCLVGSAAGVVLGSAGGIRGGVLRAAAGAAAEAAEEAANKKRKLACFVCKELYSDVIALNRHIAQLHIKKKGDDDKDGGLKSQMSSALGGLLDRALSNMLGKASRNPSQNIGAKECVEVNMELSGEDVPEETPPYEPLYEASAHGSACEMIFTCHICGDRFEKESSRKRHIAKTHKDQNHRSVYPVAADVEGSTELPELSTDVEPNEPLAIEPPSDDLQCPVCLASMKHYHSLCRHLKTQHCEWSVQAFSTDMYNYLIIRRDSPYDIIRKKYSIPCPAPRGGAVSDSVHRTSATVTEGEIDNDLAEFLRVRRSSKSGSICSDSSRQSLELDHDTIRAKAFAALRQLNTRANRAGGAMMPIRGSKRRPLDVYEFLDDDDNETPTLRGKKRVEEDSSSSDEGDSFNCRECNRAFKSLHSFIKHGKTDCKRALIYEDSSSDSESNKALDKNEAESPSTVDDDKTELMETSH